MFWTVYMGVVIFLLGLVMGSFYNVCIYRIPEELSIITPPSRCGTCNHDLGALDLIPVISWAMLGGKCRYCKAVISSRYPLVELLTGVLFVSLYWKFMISWELLLYLVFVSILIIIAFIDIDHRMIPDRFILMGIIWGGLSLFSPFIENLIFGKHTASTDGLFDIVRTIKWEDALLGGAIGACTILIIDLISRIVFKKEGMGFGDVKLMLMIGLITGVQRTIVSMLVAIWIAAIFGVVLLKTRKDKDDHYMPFGPFLAAGSVFSIFFGKELITWYMSLL